MACSLDLLESAARRLDALAASTSDADYAAVLRDRAAGIRLAISSGSFPDCDG